MQCASCATENPERRGATLRATRMPIAERMEEIMYPVMLDVDGREMMRKRFRDDVLTLTIPMPLGGICAVAVNVTSESPVIVATTVLVPGWWVRGVRVQR